MPIRILALGLVILAVILVSLSFSSAVYVAVFLAAATYAVHTVRRSGPLRFEMMVRAVLFLITGAGVLLPALVGLLNLSSLTLARLVSPESPVSRGDLLITTLAVVGLVLAARHWPAQLGETAFVVLALVGATGLKLAYVFLIRVEPLSDFGEMWKLASSVAEHGLDATRGWLGSYPHRWSFLERSLPYFLPLRLAFGPGPASYSAANVVLEGLTSLLVYRMTRTWFGACAARVALVVSLAAVETVLAAEIPTHDLPGAFLTVLSLAIALAAWRLQAEGRTRAAFLASAGLGLTVLVLDVQRATGGLTLLPISLLGLAMAPRGRRFLAALALVMVPWVMIETGNWALRQASLRAPSDLRANARWMVLAAGTDSWGDGGFTHSFSNYTIPYNTLPVSWRPLTLAKLATDTHHHPAARLTNYLRKSKSLYELGSQTIFYLNAGELRGLGSMNEARKERVLAISRWFSALFLGALAVALWRLWTAAEVPLPCLLPLFCLAILAATLLFLTEVQPRYLYPIWYLGAIYVGALFGKPAVLE